RTGRVDFPNLQVTSVDLPAGGPFASGHAVTFDYTVQNVGTKPTNTGSWSDRVALSLNTIYGDSDDLTLGVFPHSGVLGPGGLYTATQTVNLPDGITGDYHLIVETDTSNNVNEFLLEGDNVTASASTFHVNLDNYPDLGGRLHGLLDDGQPRHRGDAAPVQGARPRHQPDHRPDRVEHRDDDRRHAEPRRHAGALADLLVHLGRHLPGHRHDRFRLGHFRVQRQRPR